MELRHARPSEQLIAVPENPNVVECWRIALDMRPDLQQAKVNLEKQRITIKYSFNQLFPQLDLQASYGHNGAGSSLDRDLGLTQRGTDKNYSYGVVLSVPLENTSARANYKSAKVLLQQTVLQYKKVENTIIVAVQNDVTVAQTDLLRIHYTLCRRCPHCRTNQTRARQEHQLRCPPTAKTISPPPAPLKSAPSADYNIALEQLAYDEGITLERNRIQMP